MICFVCNVILTSGKPWGYHHVVPKAFNEAREQGCAFCARLGHPPTGHSSTLEGGAFYRWTIREAAKVEEQQDCLVVSFRSASTDNALANAIFYLLPQDDDRVGEKLGSDTWSQQSRDYVRAWITACNDPKQHANCKRPRIPQKMPGRLLDLQSEPSGRLRVVNTEETGVKAPYVTLSHCWGSAHFATLTDHNFAEYSTKGIPTEEIGRNENFSHAIEVAREIDIRYIWIDSLCIIQSNAKDWEEQAPLMHQVYRNSYCNIAASDSAGGGKGTGSGLFRDREEAYTGSQTRVMARGRWWRIVPADLWHKDLLSQVLYTRGWVFQERMLSPRMLHFTAHQIFWDCATVSACEAFPSGIPQQLDSAAAVERRWRDKLQRTQLQTREGTSDATDDEGAAYSSEAFWEMAVRVYTSCKLTKHDDKLKAMWGVAKLVRDGEREDYGAGLWADSLAEQLAWTVADTKEAQRVATFPSWSWCSIQNGVILTAQRYPAVERFYEVKDHDGEDISFSLKKKLYPVTDHSTLTSHITGESANVEPVLKSPFIQMRCLFGTAKSPDCPVPMDKSGTLRVFLDEQNRVGQKNCNFVILVASKSPEVLYRGDGNKVYGRKDTQELYSGNGLLIQQVGGNCFRRLGVFKFEGVDYATWLRICKIGGQPGGTDTEFNAEKGLDIWLV